MKPQALTDNIKTHIAADEIYRIVFLGDSITSTEWVHPNWPEIVEYVLKQQLSKETGDWQSPSWNIRCINSALDGSHTLDMLDRFADHVTYYKPNLVIYLQSSNDYHGNISPAEAAVNNQQIVQKILDLGAEVIITTTIPGSNPEYKQKMDKYVERFKEKNFDNDQITAIDVYGQMQVLNLNRFFTFASPGNPEVNMKPGDIDYMHPNPLGNAYIAHYILKEGFGIAFDPEEYIKQHNAGIMMPLYMNY